MKMAAIITVPWTTAVELISFHRWYLVFIKDWCGVIFGLSWVEVKNCASRRCKISSLKNLELQVIMFSRNCISEMTFPVVLIFSKVMKLWKIFFNWKRTGSCSLKIEIKLKVQFVVTTNKARKNERFQNWSAIKIKTRWRGYKNKICKGHGYN